MCILSFHLYETLKFKKKTKTKQNKKTTLIYGNKNQVNLSSSNLDWFQIGKEYVKAVYCHSPYLTYMQSTARETLGWKKHKPESRLPGEISITSDMQMTPSLWQKVKRN